MYAFYQHVRADEHFFILVVQYCGIVADSFHGRRIF